TITSVYRLLTDPKVDAAMKERLGPEHLRHLKQWVRDVGIAPSAGNTIHAAHLGWVKKHLRRAPLVALLGDKPTTAAAAIVLPAPSTSVTSNNGCGTWASRRLRETPSTRRIWAG